jgi:iron complex outermembrane recepter protein
VLRSSKIAFTSSALMLGASALAVIGVLAGSAAYAQDDQQIETVTVTGFRASLEKALELKRASLDSSDSIMAEDIAKFPDMNVSESLQRIPGVALNRESGEGREITVRGLGAQFTRVRINGIEAVATVGSQDVSTSNPGGSAGGTNRGRAFDFNVFASELFSQLTVHKSNSAAMEEGSLGATVDLHTAHPFDHSGFVFTTSAQAGYQDLAGSVNPRIAALVSNTFLGGRLGVLFSAAYGTSNTLEEGTSSVRWQSNINNSATAAVSTSYNFASVGGTACPTTGTIPAVCSTASNYFRPRFPRYDIVTVHGKRLGLTASVQWQPDEDTLFTLDGLYADFAQVRNEYYLEANSFSTSGKGSTTTYTNTATSSIYHVSSSGVGSINLLTYSLGGATGLDSALHSTSSITKLTASNVGLRNEHRLDHLDTRFMQFTLDGTHSFTNTLKAHVLLGWSESHHRNPLQTTLAADLGCAGAGATGTYTCGAGTSTNPYVYDYTQGNMPQLSTGNVDPASPTGWFLANVRERQEYAYNSYRTGSLDFEYAANKEVKLSGGFDFRNYGFGTLELRRSTGTTGEQSTIPDAVRSVSLSNYAMPISLKGISVPSGSNTAWFTTDLDKAAKPIADGGIGLWDQSVFPMNVAPGITNSGSVRENDYGFWLQAAWDTVVYGMSLRGDVGARYVLTGSKSDGNTYTSTGVTSIHQHNVYHDWLPSLNAVLEPMDDFLIRFNASYAMSRPTQSQMLPSGAPSVSGSNFTVSIGNSQLPPMRSKNLDLSFEWYYSKGSMISVAGFWKHLDNFVQSQQTSGIWSQNPFGFEAAPFIAACGGVGADWATVPTSSNCYATGANTSWTFQRIVSVKGAPLYGTEINWQQQFDFLPGPFDNMGVLANFTYVQAQQSYYSSSGLFLMKADLNNMSRISYNGTLYYDDQVYQARITGAFRSHYLLDPNVATNYNNYGIFVKSSFNLDASTSYKYNENLMLTLDVLNITNQASNIYADKTAQRAYQYHETGRVFYLGVKYTY